MIQYRIEVADAHAHRFLVTLRLDKPQPRQQLSLPVWIPGSYLVREFARHLSPLKARQGTRDVTVTQLDKATWEVATSGTATLTVQYEVYAFDTSVRAAFLDASRGFFNGTSVFLKAHGFEDQAHAVKITSLPKGWQVATALPAAKVNEQGVRDYLAPDYDALVDHPVEMGTFWRGEFTVRGVRHEFVVAGATADLDGQKLLGDTRRICEAQINFWHGRKKAPFDHYVFMLNVVEDGYGGLEHRQSTALICGRKDVPRVDRPLNKDAYTTLLGLISHEYFHTWNVKRLKPVEFAPYDYSQENHTRMLWFFEGFTSYYDDQFLLRTGLIDAATYIKLLGKTVNQVLSTPGRLSYSVAQASFDAWTRYYRPDENTANATVSYYTKGSLVALALDLALRELPASGKQHPSLDGVMQRLWQLGRPITSADVAKALADEAGRYPQGLQVKTGTPVEQAWQTLLDKWTEQCEELPLQHLLDRLGVAWSCKAAPLPQKWGVRVQDNNGAAKVQAVMRGGLAERIGLSAGDELLALDGWRVRKADDLTAWHDAKRAQPLLICRDQKILTLNVPALDGKATAKGAATAGHSSDVVTLSLADVAQAPDKLARRQAWLQA
ncbi:MAG: M61 family peptidase [Aquabacterium sp.]|uniref:M61 family metallopeptidase n=1 Tax=Aquabacterium sp. TaxID=1872578 RepID=UPI00121B30FE|nr:PDZ domain-containing protein [Aquabacterium sp.]TAK98731.1 MAG: M61 family peptidase [Aquabacterium sp.]